MKRIAWVALWGASLVAGFAIGIAVGKALEPEVEPRRPATRTIPKEKDREAARLLASLGRFDNVLAEKEQSIARLQTELAELRAKLPPPPSPTEKQWRKKWEEGYLRQKRYVEEGGLELYEGQHELQKKIHQRRDKALRAQGLEELAALIKSNDAGEVLRGLRILGGIDFEAIGVDKAAYKPQILGAVKHDNPEVRRRGLECLAGMCAKEEVFATALSLLDDPAAEVRREARLQLVASSGNERNDHVATALRGLLSDEDNGSRRAAVWRMSVLRQEGFDYSDEMEDVLIELSRDSDLTGEVLGFWREETALSGKVTERVVGILNAPYDPEKMEALLRAPRCEALRSQSIQTYMRILRESLDVGTRREALQELLWSRDKSVIAQLEEMASSFDAEGIEKELAQTIQSLKRYSEQPD